jgi:hypothetical protein
MRSKGNGMREGMCKTDRKSKYPTALVQKPGASQSNSIPVRLRSNLLCSLKLQVHIIVNKKVISTQVPLAFKLLLVPLKSSIQPVDKLINIASTAAIKANSALARTVKYAVRKLPLYVCPHCEDTNTGNRSRISFLSNKDPSARSSGFHLTCRSLTTLILGFVPSELMSFSGGETRKDKGSPRH